MTEGFYDHPKHARRPEPVRIAVVIPCFIPRGQEKNYGHYVENKLETLKANLAAHAHYDPGISYSLIMYDNSSPDPEGRDFLASVGASPRQNVGYSFGTWKQAWEEHEDDFDFFLFTEDDIAPSRSGWLLEIFRKFFSTQAVGAVGSFVEGRSENETMSDLLWKEMEHQQDMMYNFDGAFTFVSAEVLRQVDAIGGLPVFPCGPGEFSPTFNECVFQQPILQLGYKIVSFDDGEHCVVHGSEVFTGDIQNESKPLAPLTNLNGRHNIPKVAENYAWYFNKDHE